MINPWAKKEPSQEKMMQDQRRHEIDETLLANETHPSNADVEFHLENQNKLAELTKWQQDLSPMLSQLFKNLCGVTTDEDGNLMQIDGYQAVCNFTAAKRWIDFIKPLDKNVMNGAWTIKQVNDTMIWIDDTVVQDIIEHWKEYNVEYSIAIFDYICNSILHAVYPTFLRGLNNGERIFHGKIQKTIEAKNITPIRQQKGLFGKD